MWREYTKYFTKNNRSSGLAIRLSALISALLLSLLCGMFYNMWKYEVERITLEEGGWHSRVTGEWNREDLEDIRNFAHVKDAVVNEKGGEEVVDIYFDDLRAVLSGTPYIAKMIGCAPEKIVYNYPLLAMYLIRDENDTAPRMVFPLFLLILTMAAVSLIVIIHNSFAVSMYSRMHQFGIFSSIGATPKQIRVCLLQEAAALCAIPVLAGNLLGITGSMGLMHLTNALGSRISGRHEAVWGYHPLIFILTLLITVITIWISAWLPAWKLSRKTPLEAIKNTGELQLKRKKNSRLSAFLFGVEGELAVNALKAQRKSLRTASLSLIFSFLAFAVMQCFFSLSGISTRETYFERYQHVWDIMLTVKDAEIDSFAGTKELSALPGIRSAIVYQKAIARRIITEEEMSEEMKLAGGFSHASEEQAKKVDGGHLVNAPVVILDDKSFLSYCERIGIAPRLDGAVILNQIRDVTNPDFRHPDFMPYIKTNSQVKNEANGFSQMIGEVGAAEIPVLSYIEKEDAPHLREEYATSDHYELVHFMPASLWREIKGQIGGAEEDFYICVLGEENAAAEELRALQEKLDLLVSADNTVESENRIQEYEENQTQIRGIKAIFGGFCVLLAIIGVGNVFSNAMGFVRQRKREFARYFSIGMTPGEIRKMFCIEAVVFACRPIAIALPLAAAAVWYMLKMSYVAAGEFLAEAPLVPVVLFMLAILGAVALAYVLAWRNIRKISLTEVLRDDTML